MSKLRDLAFDPRFADFEAPQGSPGLSEPLWRLLLSREAASAVEAFTNAEMPAAAGLSGLLVAEFPAEVFKEQFRMEVGWRVRRVMEHLGYALHRKDVQINVPGIFSTGAVYLRPGIEPRDRSQRINRVQRNAWSQARIDLT